MQQWHLKLQLVWEFTAEKKYENCEKILVNYLTIAIQKVILFIRIL